MEIVLLIVILVLVIINQGKTSRNIEKVQKQLYQLNRKLDQDLYNRTKSTAPKDVVDSTETKSAEEADNKQEETWRVPDFIVQEDEPKVAAFSQSTARPVSQGPSEADVNKVLEKRQQPQPARPSFFEKYPDLEKFVGENLINKIGIGVLVLGIAFFVKYAIDQNWINEVARVGIGIACGGILIGIAHRLRSSFKSFSSVLVGGGIAVLYFTIATAFHQYGIFSQTLAFALMVVITAFAVFLSITYDRVELAILSILGGFATPFILSTGEGNYVVLFTYLIILNVGMLVLAYFKKWNSINYLTYLLTVLIFGSWMVTNAIQMEQPPYYDILLFGALFHLTFFLMNIVNNVKYKRNFKAAEISVLLSNSFLFYAAGLYAFKFIADGQFQGLFTAGMALINFLFAYYLFKKQRVDNNLLFLLIGLVLTFVSLAGPVQLEGNYITLFWASEAVLMLWLSTKTNLRQLAGASVVVHILMLLSLLMDWESLYLIGSPDMPVIFNKGFLTSLAATLSFGLAAFIYRKQSGSVFSDNKIGEGSSISKVTNPLVLSLQNYYLTATSLLGLVLLYLSGLLEFNYQLDQYVAFYPSRSVILASYHLAFFIILALFAHKRDKKQLLTASLVLFGISMIAHVLFYNGQTILVRNAFVTNAPDHFKSYLYHYLNFFLLLTMIVLSFRKSSWKIELTAAVRNKILAGISVFLLIILSMELDHLIVWISYSGVHTTDHIVNQTHKIGYPILWGVFSFGLMWVGMKFKQKELRFLSLAVLLLTLLKLFIYDIKDVSEAGKIIAFICLGVLLLIISFMYQRLKKLIIDDEKK